MSVLGALISAAVFAGLSFAVHALVLAGIGSAVVLVLYIVASATVGKRSGEAMRGAMLGINAALNFALIRALLDGGAEWGIGLALGAINLAAALGVFSKWEPFQAALGYLNWLLPMSWLVVGLGVFFTVVNALGGLIFGLLFKIEYFKLKKLQADWKTGTVFVKGGFISNLNYLDTAFNMGNFSFVDSKSADMHIDHEAGHSLNLAAFGSVFHLIGALDENLLRRGWKAFSERLAESNVPSTTISGILKMWV